MHHEYAGPSWSRQTVTVGLPLDRSSDWGHSGPETGNGEMVDGSMTAVCTNRQEDVAWLCLGSACSDVAVSWAHAAVIWM